MALIKRDVGAVTSYAEAVAGGYTGTRAQWRHLLANLPDAIVPGDNVSELVNDAGYLTSETDPTVPAWAKAANKPSYTAQEVGAMPAGTTIPSKTSDLTNDSGFINASQVPTEVFVATKGSTTYAQIKTAYEAGKTVVLKVPGTNTDSFYLLRQANNNNYLFEGVHMVQPGSYLHYYYSISSNGNWTESTSADFELVSRKVTSLSSSSTDYQYPSAKAVYDAIQAGGGGGGGASSADEVSYDNTTSELEAETVQDAIDEVVSDVKEVEPVIVTLSETSSAGQINITITSGQTESELYNSAYGNNGVRIFLVVNGKQVFRKMYTTGTSVLVSGKIVFVSETDDGFDEIWLNKVVNGFTAAYSWSASSVSAQDKRYLVTSLTSTSTDSEYPSAKCVYDLVGDVESLLNAI